MKKRFVQLKLNRQLALVSCLFLLVTMLLLWYTILHGEQDSALKSRLRDAQDACTTAQAQAQRTAELCNMSAQVYLNTPQLTEYLAKLKRGDEISAAEMLSFYRVTIASLEKITLSNPDLYRIRVYAEADGINEMMPILFDRRRTENIPWAKEDLSSGLWHFDYEDKLLSDYATPHIMSLITEIADPVQGVLGTLEVSVHMDEVFPELFSDENKDKVMLISKDGGKNGAFLAGNCDIDPEELLRLAELENGAGYRLNGESFLAAKTELKEFDCVYLRLAYTSDVYHTMLEQSLFLLAVMLVIFSVLFFLMSQLTRRILRGFYGAFDGIRDFAEGNIDAVVEVNGQGEIADFARKANALLDEMRRLMRDNLERETRAQRAELKSLQNQINAHFIYNVLEAIKMMAEIDEEYEIADTVTTLGKLLRYSLKLEGGGVRLERELDNIKNYIALMNLRFDYTITLDTDVPIELLGQTVPKLFLQPIVENAVVHGTASLAADSVITVAGVIDAENACYTLKISDKGAGMDETALETLRRRIAGEDTTTQSSGNGIGLKNVNDRIQTLFGEEYGLSVSSILGTGTTVILTLPYHEEEKKDENDFDLGR